MTACPSEPGAIAGLDPGRSKCGLVLSDSGRQGIVAAAILSPAESLALLRHWRGQGLGLVVLGDGTGSAPWPERLAELGLTVTRLDERGTTLAARQRYWQLHPPRHWRRCLPRGLRLPPRDIDDVVAQLLLERHLGQPLQRRSPAVWRELPAGLAGPGHDPRSGPAQ
jgi:RNase H-fold protein (predicted Holliday junction resolvase)